jgi:hypothetical protein
VSQVYWLLQQNTADSYREGRRKATSEQQVQVTSGAGIKRGSKETNLDCMARGVYGACNSRLRVTAQQYIQVSWNISTGTTAQRASTGGDKRQTIWYSNYIFQTTMNTKSSVIDIFKRF